MNQKKQKQLEELGYIKRHGDRKDGRLIRDIDSTHNYMFYLMKNRCDAEVSQIEELDVTEMLRFIRKHNEAHPDQHMTLFHCVIAAFAKTIKTRPKMNYFVDGHHLYERDHLTFGYVAKNQFSDHGEESVMVLDCKDGQNVYDISAQVRGDVKEVRTGRHNTADAGLDILLKMPGWVNRLFVWWQRWSDAHRWYPLSLMEVDPDFVTVLISNLGSIDCNACYHHLNNFGTNSIVVTIGVIHRRPVFKPDGSWELRDFANFGFTLDERIADGFYFARSIRIFDHILQHPELLESPISEEVKYEFKR